MDKDEKQLKGRLQEIREWAVIPDPTIHYKVGDRVRYGAIEKTTILEVLDGHRIYRIRKEGERNHYGTMIPFKEEDYVAWTDILPFYVGSTPFSTLRNERADLHTNSYRRELIGLLHSYYKFGIDMDPPYQRGNVWTRNDQCGLIESIFQRIDIGKICLVLRKYAPGMPRYEMLDGKQRLTALLEYRENRFAYKNQYFFDLDRADQYFFDRTVLTVDELNENVSLADIYWQFIRLNTAGRTHRPKHLKRVWDMLREEEGDQNAN